ncbi:DUF2231 domain-containing protein [Desertihabitans brevis]|uniref:DUF2231 domain-containing protein n=1 Tax=Desertihabitans brevis TaxID=2268447 RepID=A0A367YRP6_9ACTN|nr:Rieske 2Fe-2S domain-containing protein [Desertihabitans brevis]RCK68565.1 DUF2231 domain-containing protein [Desertihabitans brevis]
MLINRFGTLFERLVRRIETAESLDATADPVAERAGRLYGGPRVRSLLAGTPLSHPLHPLLITVPIGSWAAAMVLDLVGNKSGARTAIGVGLLTAPLAAATGTHDWTSTVGGQRRVGWVHALLNVSAIGLYAASWMARRRGHHRAGQLLTIPGFALLGASGSLGGHLSYARGVGVDVTAFDPEVPGWVDVAASTEVEHGRLTGASAAGVELVLTRDADDTLHALADRCTHRGGPLHEGTLEDGCVRCPWHDSRFSLADGSVVTGPATRPQPVFETREEDGRVLVRHLATG